MELKHMATRANQIKVQNCNEKGINGSRTVVHIWLTALAPCLISSIAIRILCLRAERRGIQMQGSSFQFKLFKIDTNEDQGDDAKDDAQNDNKRQPRIL